MLTVLIDQEVNLIRDKKVKVLNLLVFETKSTKRYKSSYKNNFI